MLELFCWIGSFSPKGLLVDYDSCKASQHPEDQLAKINYIHFDLKLVSVKFDAFGFVLPTFSLAFCRMVSEQALLDGWWCRHFAPESPSSFPSFSLYWSPS